MKDLILQSGTAKFLPTIGDGKSFGQKQYNIIVLALSKSKSITRQQPRVKKQTLLIFTFKVITPLRPKGNWSSPSVQSITKNPQ